MYYTSPYPGTWTQVAMAGATNGAPFGWATGGSVYINNGAGLVDVRSGGSFSWRNNNPGNIVAGRFATANAAIGTNGRFAIFPDYTTGFNALTSLLNTPTYQSQTVFGAISTYTPAIENNPAAYSNFVTNALGVSLDTQMSTLSSSQINAMGQSIQTFEGWQQGSSTQWFWNF